MATQRKLHGVNTDTLKHYKESVKHRDEKKEEDDDLKLLNSPKNRENVGESEVDQTSKDDNRTYYSMLISLSLLSLISRLYNIDKPAHVW